MADICPTVTAYDTDEYRQQLGRITPFARRLHIDLMDGVFAPTKSPGLSEIWLPPHKLCDIHLMYKRPMDSLDKLIKLRPHMVVIHNEADVHHMHFSAALHAENIKTGLAILHDTPVDHIQQIMHSFDHVLVFSGNLGHHGGKADLQLLEKVRQIRREYPDVEIGWDGGIDDQNAAPLVSAGVDVLNVGGYIQRAENAGAHFRRIEAALAG